MDAAGSTGIPDPEGFAIISVCIERYPMYKIYFLICVICSPVGYFLLI